MIISHRLFTAGAAAGVLVAVSLTGAQAADALVAKNEKMEGMMRPCAAQYEEVKALWNQKGRFLRHRAQKSTGDRSLMIAKENCDAGNEHDAISYLDVVRSAMGMRSPDHGHGSM